MDYLKINEILMRRRNKVILPVVEIANTETTNKYVCTMIKNIEGKRKIIRRIVLP